MGNARYREYEEYRSRMIQIYGGFQKTSRRLQQMNLVDTYRAEMTKEANNTLVLKIKQLEAHYGITVSEAEYWGNYQTEDDEDGKPQSPPFPGSSDVISPPPDLMPYNTETPTLHRTSAEKVGTPRNGLIRRASTLGRMKNEVRIVGKH